MPVAPRRAAAYASLARCPSSGSRYLPRRGGWVGRFAERPRALAARDADFLSEVRASPSALAGGDAAGGAVDALERAGEVFARMHGREAVVPGEVEVHPLLERRREEAAPELAVPARRLAVRARLVFQAKEQAEARAQRL